MHYLILPPTGWGFMLIHKMHEQGATIVTDGGSLSFRARHNHSSCYQETLRTIGDFFRHAWKPRKRWAWILSHMDYDHYSITVGLIKAHQWPRPKLIVLPAVYSPRACREVLAEYHRLAYLIATTLKIPPPSTTDLISITSNAERLGVAQGAKLYAKELAYHIIWPPLPSMIDLKCKTLLRKLDEKLEKAVKKCIERRGREACEKAWRRGEEEATVFVETLAPNRITEVVDLDVELMGEADIERDRKEARYQPEMPWPDVEHSTYEYVYIQAAEEFGDLEFLKLYTSIINNFSLAYALECGRHLKECMGCMRINVKEFRSSITWTTATTTCCELSLFNRIPLLYLSDLEGEALTQAISYYRRHMPNKTIDVAIEVAAHHGNAYSPKLRYVIPRILFFPRCNKHVSRHIRRNFRYQWRFWNLPVCTRIYSGHTYGLEAEIYL